MKLNLSGERFLCQDLRAWAPQHTYANDLEILLSMKSLLDLNMQIPSYEERWLVDLLHRAPGGTLKAQQTLLALIIPLIEPASSNDTEGQS